MSNTHKAIIIAETAVLADQMQLALNHIGAPSWLTKQADQNISSAELLTEFAGRLCYKSFEVGLNPNVTKVREGNQSYLGNVLKQKHGSVFEHSTTTLALLNVSRILTHELVRHRAGTAYSQESQRFVRLDDFQLYIPDLTEALTALAPADLNEGTINTDAWVQQMQDEFVAMSERISNGIKTEVTDYLAKIGIDAEGVSFHVKKTLTSALRRLIPGGVNTNIIVTANHRTWRHLVANRTAAGAEVEIREVFYDVGMQLRDRYPNIYQDLVIDDVDGIGGTITFLNEKI